MDKLKPKVTVIICCYTLERLKDVLEAIESVKNQTQTPDEILVPVDHNQELLQKLQEELPADVKLILNEGAQGLSETRNVGIRAAQGDIVAFIDDDAVAENNWLKDLIQDFDDVNVMAVGGRAIPVWPSGKRPFWFPEELDWTVGCTFKGLTLDGNRVRNVIGCNMAFRKDVFSKVCFFDSAIGGIKEISRGGEESALCLRIKHMIPGSLILYRASAIIHHRVPRKRLKLRYLANRCYNEGYYKRFVEKFASGFVQKSLTTESSYLRYLLFTSIPERLKRFYKKDAFPQIGAIVAGMAVTVVGYLVGRLKREDSGT
jgi:glycosyltransferase involved in cell wall biosynthesis